jgi:hypothetical protein
MPLNGWDHAPKVIADGKGLVGHAGVVLLRKAADQPGRTAGLSAALLKKGTSALRGRGTVLVSLAVAILGRPLVARGQAVSGAAAATRPDRRSVITIVSDTG